MNDEIYQNLIDWLNQAWFGLPDSPHLMDAVKAVYTPEEAAMLAGFPHGCFNLWSSSGIGKQKK